MSLCPKSYTPILIPVFFHLVPFFIYIQLKTEDCLISNFRATLYHNRHQVNYYKPVPPTPIILYHAMGQSIFSKLYNSKLVLFIFPAHGKSLVIFKEKYHSFCQRLIFKWGILSRGQTWSNLSRSKADPQQWSSKTTSLSKALNWNRWCFFLCVCVGWLAAKKMVVILSVPLDGSQTP